MKSFNKFLLNGALIFGAVISGGVHADGRDISSVEIEFLSQVVSVVQKQKSKGNLTIPSDIGLKILDENVVEQTERGLRGASETARAAYFSFDGNGKCKINLSFDKFGNFDSLAIGESAREMTSLKNEQQKKIMREFITLHEHYHCEFSGIESPIKISDNDELNKRANSFLLGISSYEGVLDGESFSGYIGLLNETFADVSAMVSLVSEYGADNKDLIYVLNSLALQRESGYVLEIPETHFTHFALKELLKEENLKKAGEVSGDKLKEFSLEIANNSVVKLFLDKGRDYMVLQEASFQHSVEESFALKMLAGISPEDFNAMSNNRSGRLSGGLVDELVMSFIEKNKLVDVVKEKIKSDLEIVDSNFVFSMDKMDKQQLKIIEENVNAVIPMVVESEEFKKMNSEYGGFFKEFTVELNKKKSGFTYASMDGESLKIRASKTMEEMRESAISQVSKELGIKTNRR